MKFIVEMFFVTMIVMFFLGWAVVFILGVPENPPTFWQIVVALLVFGFLGMCCTAANMEGTE